MDDWVYPVGVQPPTYEDIANGAAPRPQIIEKLRGIAQSRPVTYLVGNHDITITKNSVPNFGNRACPHIIFQGSYDMDGLWAEHGHQYDIWKQSHPDIDCRRMPSTSGKGMLSLYLFPLFSKRFLPFRGPPPSVVQIRSPVCTVNPLSA
jgi:UDP-2,3-diacylglucosamine pyrophosphatase LpxH